MEKQTRCRFRSLIYLFILVLCVHCTLIIADMGEGVSEAPAEDKKVEDSRENSDGKVDNAQQEKINEIQLQSTVVPTLQPDTAELVATPPPSEEGVINNTGVTESNNNNQNINQNNKGVDLQTLVEKSTDVVGVPTESNTEKPAENFPNDNPGNLDQTQNNGPATVAEYNQNTESIADKTDTNNNSLNINNVVINVETQPNGQTPQIDNTDTVDNVDKIQDGDNVNSNVDASQTQGDNLDTNADVDKTEGDDDADNTQQDENQNANLDVDNTQQNDNQNADVDKTQPDDNQNANIDVDKTQQGENLDTNENDGAELTYEKQKESLGVDTNNQAIDANPGAGSDNNNEAGQTDQQQQNVENAAGANIETDNNDASEKNNLGETLQDNDDTTPDANNGDEMVNEGDESQPDDVNYTDQSQNADDNPNEENADHQKDWNYEWPTVDKDKNEADTKDQYEASDDFNKDTKSDEEGNNPEGGVGVVPSAVSQEDQWSSFSWLLVILTFVILCMMFLFLRRKHVLSLFSTRPRKSRKHWQIHKSEDRKSLLEHEV